MTLTRKKAAASGLALLVAVTIAGYGISVAAPTETYPPDPNAGLSGEQLGAKFAKDKNDYDRRYADWLQSDYVENLDLSTIPTSIDNNVLYGDGTATLDQATDEAEVAVQGVVTDLTFVPGQSVASFSVTDTAKGDVPSTISIVQTAYLEPENNFNTARLIVDEAQPLLKVGDEAILLLEEEPAGADIDAGSGYSATGVYQGPTYRVQPVSGQYQIDPKSKKIKKTKRSRIADVEGKDPKQVFDRIKESAQEK